MPQPPQRMKEFSARFHKVSSAFNELSTACHDAGPLDEKSRRLVKLALSIGAGLEGATHSAVRHALEIGVTEEELEHIVVLGITTLGWPASFRAMTWIGDCLQKEH